jgi:hypothetical protein
MTSSTERKDRMRTFSTLLTAVALGLASAGAGLAPVQPAHAQRPVAASKVRLKRVLDRSREPERERARGRFGDKSYDGVRRAALDLMRTFSPEQHFFLGVGRSPVRVIAFLKTLSEQGEASMEEGTTLAASLPASGIKDGIPDRHLPEVYRHFDRFLPEDVQRGERAVVLIDTVSSGASVNVIATALESYFAQKGVSGKVIRSGFGTEKLRGFKVFDYYQYPSAVATDGGGKAEYEPHELAAGATLEQLRPNPEHGTIRYLLLAHMRSDTELDTALSTEFQRLLGGNEGAAQAGDGAAKADNGAARADNGAAKQGQGAAGAKSRLRRWGLRELPATNAPNGGLAMARGDKRVEVLEASQYADLRTGATQLLERFPPVDAAYVGVGRSSSAVHGFLEKLGTDSKYLPADGLKKDLEEGTNLRELEQAFFTHFQLILPRAALQGKKRIVLHQRSDTGATLPLVKQFLESYLRAQGSNAAVEAVAFSASAGRKADVKVIDTRQLPGLDALGDKLVKSYALHPFHRIGTDQDLQRVTPSAEFQSFSAHLGQFMGADAQLRAFVDAPAP